MLLLMLVIAAAEKQVYELATANTYVDMMLWVEDYCTSSICNNP